MFILGSLIVFNLYKRSEPNKAILVNNCFKPGAGILGFKEAEEYLMMIECLIFKLWKFQHIESFPTQQ